MIAGQGRRKHQKVGGGGRFRGPKKVWLRNVVKCGKYSFAKFANFVYFCIACDHFRPKCGRNVVGISARNIKVYKIC